KNRVFLKAYPAEAGFSSTRYIKHLAESANFKGGTLNKHCNGLIGNRFEMPNVSYTHPLYPIRSKKFYYEENTNAILDFGFSLDP
ncbi:MAG TPA: hypothetical protein PLU49_14940, partial [Saprospiraceae bacterium]|nr:hypothetical protein [Saprospiraceae bacterium]